MDVLTMFQREPLSHNDDSEVRIGQHPSRPKDHHTPVSFHSIEALSRGVGSSSSEEQLQLDRKQRDSTRLQVMTSSTMEITMPKTKDSRSSTSPVWDSSMHSNQSDRVQKEYTDARKLQSNYEKLMFDGRSESYMVNNIKMENNDIGGEMDSSFETKSKRHTRTIYSAKQVLALEEAYSNCHYPSRETLDQLAVDFSLTDEKIRIWFQNKRARSRRQCALQAKLAESSKPASHTDTTPFRPVNITHRVLPFFAGFSSFSPDASSNILSLTRSSSVADTWFNASQRYPRFEHRIPFLPLSAAARLPPILPPASLVNPASLMRGFDSFRATSYINGGWQNNTKEIKDLRRRYPLCESVNHSRDMLQSVNHEPLQFVYNNNSRM